MHLRNVGLLQRDLHKAVSYIFCAVRSRNLAKEECVDKTVITNKKCLYFRKIYFKNAAVSVCVVYCIVLRVQKALQLDAC
jgi:hypothetical protein